MVDLLETKISKFNDMFSWDLPSSRRGIHGMDDVATHPGQSSSCMTGGGRCAQKELQDSPGVPGQLPRGPTCVAHSVAVWVVWAVRSRHLASCWGGSLVSSDAAAASGAQPRKHANQTEIWNK